MDVLEMLINFNITRQEAVIYKLLYEEGEMSGYEVAKKTGISRSNAYTSLANLVDKGGAYVIEGKVTHYTPVSIGDFCENKINKLNELKIDLIENMPKRKEEYNGYITIQGKENILNKMKLMLEEAKERVYISVSDLVLGMVIETIKRKLNDGLKIVIITNREIFLENAMMYYTDRPKHQIRLIADSKNVLTGDISIGENSTSLYSRNRNLVELFKDSLTNEIKLLELQKGK